MRRIADVTNGDVQDRDKKHRSAIVRFHPPAVKKNLLSQLQGENFSFFSAPKTAAALLT